MPRAGRDRAAPLRAAPCGPLRAGSGAHRQVEVRVDVLRVEGDRLAELTPGRLELPVQPVSRSQQVVRFRAAAVDLERAAQVLERVRGVAAREMDGGQVVACRGVK